MMAVDGKLANVPSDSLWLRELSKANTVWRGHGELHPVVVALAAADWTELWHLLTTRGGCLRRLREIAQSYPMLWCVIKRTTYHRRGCVARQDLLYPVEWLCGFTL